MSDIKGKNIHIGHFNLFNLDYKDFFFPPPQLVIEGHQERWDTLLNQNKLIDAFEECA